MPRMSQEEDTQWTGCLPPIPSCLRAPVASDLQGAHLLLPLGFKEESFSFLSDLLLLTLGIPRSPCSARSETRGTSLTLSFLQSKAISLAHFYIFKPRHPPSPISLQSISGPCHLWSRHPHALPPGPSAPLLPLCPSTPRP